MFDRFSKKGPRQARIPEEATARVACARLDRLPVELLGGIASYLDDADVLNMRLVSKGAKRAMDAYRGEVFDRALVDDVVREPKPKTRLERLGIHRGPRRPEGLGGHKAEPLNGLSRGTLACTRSLRIGPDDGEKIVYSGGSYVPNTAIYPSTERRVSAKAINDLLRCTPELERLELRGVMIRASDLEPLDLAAVPKLRSLVVDNAHFDVERTTSEYGHTQNYPFGIGDLVPGADLGVLLPLARAPGLRELTIRGASHSDVWVSTLAMDACPALERVELTGTRDERTFGDAHLAALRLPPCLKWFKLDMGRVYSLLKNPRRVLPLGLESFSIKGALDRTDGLVLPAGLRDLAIVAHTVQEAPRARLPRSLQELEITTFSYAWESWRQDGFYAARLADYLSWLATAPELRRLIVSVQYDPDKSQDGFALFERDVRSHIPRVMIERGSKRWA